MDVLPRDAEVSDCDRRPEERAISADVARLLRLETKRALSVSVTGLAAWALVIDRLLAVPDQRVKLGGSGHVLVIKPAPQGTSGAEWLAAVARQCSDSPVDFGGADCGWLEDASQAPQEPAQCAVWVGLNAAGTRLVAYPGVPGVARSGLRSLLDSALRALEQLVCEPDRLIDDFSVVSPGDAHRLADWSVGTWRYDGPMNVVDRFLQIVQRFPQRTAVAWHGGSLDYATLAERSAKVAGALVAAGVRPGDVVGTALPRSVGSIVALLGVLRAGAAYLPLDVGFPVERLEFMLADARTQLILTDASLGDRLPVGTRRLLLDELAATGPAALPLPAPDGRAYVMYTSGSTGEPKGVQVAHRSIVRLVCDADFMTLDADVVMLHAAPLGFDASTLEIWGPLLNGGCCVPHDEAVPSGVALAASIQEHGVRTAWLTAALFNAIVDDNPCHLAGLSELLIGGEALSVDHVSRFLTAVPGTALINGYGPTECTTFATTHRIEPASLANAKSIPIGRPISATQVHVFNARAQPLPVGLIGELYIGGLGVSEGYLGRPDLNRERFVAHPAAGPGCRLYRTGDRVRHLGDGALEFIGRVDGQVKIRGYRIEPGEIEVVLASHPAVCACAVVARHDPNRGAELVAYVVPRADVWEPASLRKRLAERLPDFMVPAHYVRLAELPLTGNGKLDRRALPAPRLERPAHLDQPMVEPRPGLERTVAAAFSAALGLEDVGALDNFFELGGSSLLVMRVHAALRAAGHTGLSVATMFAAPTARGLAQALNAVTPAVLPSPSAGSARAPDREPIAIVGMAGRFPGAADIEAFWAVLDEGRDTVRCFRDDELDASIPVTLRADPRYVKTRGVIDGVDLFDAGFFGISPIEAELMDPQQRLFLELCWECLERAGQVPEKTAQTIGVFAGMYNATYFQRHGLGHPDKIERLGEFQVMLANEKDYLASRVAHKLGLTGPAISVYTACSTSLVAIAQAFDALRAGQCGLALAGGVSITCPPNSGYLYEEGSMLSPDGHTRSFDSDAQGTVFSDGAAVVLLKRLSDALADGNTIHAVIRSVAVNNDGAEKASFTAPSVLGQATVITAAIDGSGIDPRTISYIETHGTATPLGDPVEVAALSQAFSRYGAGRGSVLIGSLKSNTGHMVIAAGAAGVIKTALALTHECLPGTVHFKSPNPKIGLETSPFRVTAQRTPWPRGAHPRRAGVSSFGVGGTNAHAILEEAPQPAWNNGNAGPQLLKVSARSATALAASMERLALHLEAHGEPGLADVAYTLDVGRRDFAHRSFVAAETSAQAVAALRSPESARVRSRVLPSVELEAVLLFPGQGSQYAGMGRELHAGDATFRSVFDECLAALEGHVAFDLRALMFGDDPAPLAETSVTQPAIFCLEYALARSWQARGLSAAALVGHSVGEFVAAVLAGVMSLAAASRLVALRGALMQALPPGAMLSVRMAAATLETLLPVNLQLAAENGPNACVVAGPSAAIDAFAAALAKREIVTRRLQTSHAFHSAMMDPALPAFEAAVATVGLAAPRLRIASTVTGDWLTDEQARSPAYWARHLREPVRFSRAVRTVLAGQRAPLFVECGPRAMLTTLTRQHRGKAGGPAAVASLGDDPARECLAMIEAAGQLWIAGVPVRWCHEPPSARRRIVLPSYPFERKRHWLEAPQRVGMAAGPGAPAAAPLNPTTPATATVISSTFRPATTAITLAQPPHAVPLTLPPSSSSAEAVMTSLPLPAAPSRRPALVERLRTVFEDVAGIELGDVDASASFVELGLDSLTLTQVAMQLKKNFALPITFRQLMESLVSFDALAAYFDEKLPAEAVPVAVVPAGMAAAAAVAAAVAGPAVAAAAPAAPTPMQPTATSATGLSLVQSVIQQQMQLMAQQLTLLQGQPAMPTAVEAAQSIAPAQPVAAAPVAPGLATARRAPALAVEDGVSAPAVDAALIHRTYDVKKAFGAIARIHTTKIELTARQRARLDAFMRRYVEKTRRSKDYTVEHRSHMADPRVVNGFRPLIKEIVYQIVIQRSKGSRMWDLDDNEYVDVLSGFGMNMFGWQPDFVVDAVRQQLDLGYDIGPQHPLAGEVCRLLCELTSFDRAALCNTGSEAVMAAIRIARTVTGRGTVVLFTGSYHGTFDEVLVRAGRNGRGISAAPGVMSGVFGDVRVLDYGTSEALAFIRENAVDLAAVLVEPVQSRRPNFQPREFLREVREITLGSGTCLIFDEVITGFRCDLGGAQAVLGIRADLACYGKVIGGGFPVGAVAGKREYMDALDGGGWQYGNDSMPTVGVTYFAGTFVRHPLALAAAKASLDHLKARGPALQVQLNERTAAMADELSAFCREIGAPLEIHYFASLWRVGWLEDHPLQDLLFAMMRSRGVHILDNFPCFFTTAHTEADIEFVATAFKDSVRELQESEFLPRHKVPVAMAFDASHPPTAGARLGKDADGKPAWFVKNPDDAGKYLKVTA